VTERQEAFDAKMQRLGNAITAVLASPAGRQLMEDLEACFVRGDLRGRTVEETYYNLGARGVVEKLKRYAEHNERTGTTNG
jgi:hypothetical protein